MAKYPTPTPPKVAAITAAPPPPSDVTPNKAMPCTRCEQLTFDVERLCIACRRDAGQTVGRPPLQSSPLIEDRPPPEDHLAAADRRTDESGFPLCTGKDNTCANRAAGGICSECLAAEAKARQKAEDKARSREVETITIKAPTATIQLGGFAAVSHVEVNNLTQIQQRGLVRLADGLDTNRVRLSNGSRVDSLPQAVRWLLETLGTAG